MNTNDSSLNIEDLNSAFGLDPGQMIYNVDDNLINIINSTTNNEPMKDGTLNTFNDFINNDESANLLPFPHLEDSADPMFSSEHILNPNNSNLLSNFSFSDVNFATSAVESDHHPTTLQNNIPSSSFQISNLNSVEDTFEKFFAVRLKCKTCGESFDEDDHEARRQHFITKHFRTSITSSVPGTSLSTDVKTNMKPKAKAKLKHRKRFVCTWGGCNFRARMNSHLQEHYRIHTGERPFVCQWPGCGKTFPRNSALKAHGNTHTGVKKYECTFPGCSSKFITKFNLKAHMISHTDEKAFQCNWPGCTSAFRRKQLLQNHIKTHLGEQDYVCDHPQCDFKTAYPTCLTRHKLTHSSSKSFACDHSDCTFVARSSTDLKSHKAIHSKKFICNICDKAFARRTQLDKHNGTHHQQFDTSS